MKANVKAHDGDQLVVLATLIRLEVVSESLGVLGNVSSLGGLKVRLHSVVEGEDGGGSTDLSSHVADGSHTSAREGLDSRSVVLDDGSSSSLDGEDTSDLADDVCKRQNRTTREKLNATHRTKNKDIPLGVVHPEIFPSNRTPMTLGHFNSQGMSAITSTASAPPTPQAIIPRPPALGVWESVPIIIPPGKA